MDIDINKIKFTFMLNMLLRILIVLLFIEVASKSMRCFSDRCNISVSNYFTLAF